MHAHLARADPCCAARAVAAYVHATSQASRPGRAAAWRACRTAFCRLATTRPASRPSRPPRLSAALLTSCGDTGSSPRRRAAAQSTTTVRRRWRVTVLLAPPPPHWRCRAATRRAPACAAAGTLRRHVAPRPSARRPCSGAAGPLPASWTAAARSCRAPRAGCAHAHATCKNTPSCWTRASRMSCRASAQRAASLSRSRRLQEQNGA